MKNKITFEQFTFKQAIESKAIALTLKQCLLEIAPECEKTFNDRYAKTLKGLISDLADIHLPGGSKELLSMLR